MVLPASFAYRLGVGGDLNLVLRSDFLGSGREFAFRQRHALWRVSFLVDHIPAVELGWCARAQVSFASVTPAPGAHDLSSVGTIAFLPQAAAPQLTREAIRTRRTVRSLNARPTPNQWLVGVLIRRQIGVVEMIV